jgi:hypothetical protein
MGSLNMLMETDTKEPGEMDSARITEYTNTQTEMSMMESGATTPSKVRESLIWLLAINTRVIGKLERKMEKVNIFLFRSVCFCQRGHLRRIVSERK